MDADRRHRHAALDPALERPGLIWGEVVLGPGAQQLDDVRQAVGRFDGVAARPRRRGLGGVLGQPLRDVGYMEDGIDGAGGDGAARHPVIPGLAGLLGDDGAPGLLDREQAGAAIGAGAGQHDTARACPAVPCHRLEERVERKAGAAPGRDRPEMQQAVGEGQEGSGRDDV